MRQWFFFIARLVQPLTVNFIQSSAYENEPMCLRKDLNSRDSRASVQTVTFQPQICQALWSNDARILLICLPSCGLPMIGQRATAEKDKRQCECKHVHFSCNFFCTSESVRAGSTAKGMCIYASMYGTHSDMARGKVEECLLPVSGCAGG